MTTIDHLHGLAARTAVSRPETYRDLLAAEQAARVMLESLGVDLNSESSADTPARMVRAFDEMLTPRDFEPTTFPNDNSYNQLVIQRHIPFQSLCEHHFLPFTGYACLGYLPGERLLGLSKLARVVEHFSRRPQLQERLTQQIADWLHEHLRPGGVGVILVAEHQCISLRGVSAAGSTTLTSAMRGSLLVNAHLRDEFLRLATAQQHTPVQATCT
jgi:GTP cyclohydrolase I